MKIFDVCKMNDVLQNIRIKTYDDNKNIILLFDGYNGDIPKEFYRFEITKILRENHTIICYCEKNRTSDAQLRANQKYLENFAEIKIRVTAEEKEKIKAKAEAKEMSVNAYILSLVARDI